jgi:transcription elongation factor Elf1
MNDTIGRRTRGAPVKKRLKKTPEPCPRCGSHDIVPIMYGYTMPDAMEAAKRGEIELGGCRIGESDPQKHCKACGERFDFRPTLAAKRARIKK